MLEEEEELDDETVQARVDASLARIYSVTSTWLKPKKTPSAPRKTFEKELEEILRRPPRLGVGAELPENQVKSGPGELKLKNKMLGNKRDRGETNLRGSTDTPALDDDEEDSKSRVIQKKPRLDPFASSKKKGRRLNAPTAIYPHKPADNYSAFQINPEKGKVATPIRDEDSPVPYSLKTGSVCDDESDEAEERPVVGDVVKARKPTSDLPPLLCLHGPPTLRDSAEFSHKKKRRHKRKKKRPAGGVTIVVPQVPTS